MREPRPSRIEILEEAIGHTKKAIEEARHAEPKEDKLSPHQRIAAHDKIRGLRERILDIQEAQDLIDKARSVGGLEQRLLAQETQILRLKSELRERSRRADDLEESLSALRGES